MESFTKSAQRLPNILLTSFPWRRVHFFASDHILISVSQINCNWPHDICLNHQKTLTKRSIKRERCENRIVKRPVKVVRDRSRDSLTKKCGRKSQYISTSWMSISPSFYRIWWLSKKAKLNSFIFIGNTKWKLNSVIHHTTYSSLCPVNDMKGDTFSTTSSRYSRPQEILDHSCSLFLK